MFRYWAENGSVGNLRNLTQRNPKSSCIKQFQQIIHRCVLTLERDGEGLNVTLQYAHTWQTEKWLSLSSEQKTDVCCFLGLVGGRPWPASCAWLDLPASSPCLSLKTQVRLWRTLNTEEHTERLCRHECFVETKTNLTGPEQWVKPERMWRKEGSRITAWGDYTTLHNCVSRLP